MLLDWFTIAAQGLNFLILVWLMKRFLYRPILQAIDTREKLIAKELAEAETKRTEAEKERDDFRQRNEAFDRQRAELVSQAEAEVKGQRQQWLDAARQAADDVAAARQAALHTDARTLITVPAGFQLVTTVDALVAGVHFFADDPPASIARKVLAELAAANLEERMSELFTRRLRELPDGQKATLGEALKKSAEPAGVRSALELAAGSRAAIQNALNETFSAEIRIRFAKAPELVGGIELSAGGQKAGWNIAEYLADLEKRLAELLTAKVTTGAKPEAEKPALQSA